MAITRQIPVQIKTPAAVYAVVGAGDLVVERLRAAQVERKNVQSQVSSFPTKAQAVATERFNAVVSDVRALPEQVRTLPVAAQARVQASVAAALGQATGAYGDLAKRGESLVSRIGRQKSTLATVDAAKVTTSRAKATSTTAKKAAKETVTRAKATTTTARKAAKETTTRAKATRTTASKTATAAAQATTDAAKKIGD
jgi:hypothetical protein